MVGCDGVWGVGDFGFDFGGVRGGRVWEPLPSVFWGRTLTVKGEGGRALVIMGL